MATEHMAETAVTNLTFSTQPRPETSPFLKKKAAVTTLAAAAAPTA